MALRSAAPEAAQITAKRRRRDAAGATARRGLADAARFAVAKPQSAPIE
jgi:hypothetical protein